MTLEKRLKFLDEYNFTSQFERVVWEYYSNGLTAKEIHHILTQLNDYTLIYPLFPDISIREIGKTIRQLNAFANKLN